MSFKKSKAILAVFLSIFILLTAACGANKDESNNSQDGQRRVPTPVEGNKQTDSSDDPTQPQEKETEEEIDLVAKQLEQMTLNEKIGQMLMVGFEGQTINDNIREMIKDYHIGGFVLFKRNVSDARQLVDLTNGLKAENADNNIPLFISVDEEGGKVTRMPDELKKLPSSGRLGKVGDGKLSKEVGMVMGQMLKDFGLNMNYAPVLDINSNPNNPVIGDRSFGADAELVRELGIQTMKGMQSEEVIPVVKHFPGHGDTSVDSHIGLPRVDHGMDRLKGFELVPFADAIEEGTDVVMVAHILFSKIDPENPSTLSKAIITDLLKEDLGFKGVVITDDMTMGAIIENYSIGDAAVKSILAGSDIVSVCHNYSNIVEAVTSIKNAVEEGVITEDRIDESVYKILKLKNKYGLADEPVELPDIGDLNKKIDKILKTAS